MKEPGQIGSARSLHNMMKDKDKFFNLYMMDAEYVATSSKEVAESQSHLIKVQQDKLQLLLADFEELFNGKLGKYKGKKLRLEVDTNSTPFHARPYAVAKAHEEIFLQDLTHLVEIGVLKPIRATQWAAPTFITPKKDDRVRWVTDFRQLNKSIKRRVYPLPRIKKILNKRPRYEFFSKLDIWMCYYTFELEQDSQELCTIVTP